MVEPHAGQSATASGRSRKIFPQAGQSRRSYGCSSADSACVGGEGTMVNGTGDVWAAMTGTGSRGGGVSSRGSTAGAAGDDGGSSTGIGCACERGFAPASGSGRLVVLRLNRPTPHPQ